jgi:hypothetical protein
LKEPRRLSLARESLVDLTPADLAAVQGGVQAITKQPCTFSALCQMTFNTCDCVQ